MRSDQKSLADIYSKIITESSGRKVIKGNVYLRGLYLKELPEWLSDVEIEGSFSCSNNKLTTLQGAPKAIKDTFYCHNNKLTTLAGAPKTVGGTFWCDDNKLTTLAGAPRTVRGNFSCHNNPGNFTKEDVIAVSRVDGNIDV